MPKSGLDATNCAGVLVDKAQKSGWSLCVGAGISKPFFPDWSKLVQKLASGDSIIGRNRLPKDVRQSYSLDALIEAARDRLQITPEEFPNKLSRYLYSSLKWRVGAKDWSKFLTALTAGSPGQLTREQWRAFIRKINEVSQDSTALQIAKVVPSASNAELEPAAIITFNAEPLLYALITAVSAMQAPADGKLSKSRLLDRVTRSLSYREAGRIPFIFCHGLLPVKGGLDKFNESTAQDKLVFSEGGYLQLANSNFSWQSSLFLGTAVLRSMVFIGLSFSDPNLRRWLAWINKNRSDELDLRGKDPESYNHYWIKSSKGLTQASQRWHESAVRHLGVRLVWIDDWSGTGTCLREMLNLPAN